MELSHFKSQVRNKDLQLVGYKKIQVNVQLKFGQAYMAKPSRKYLPHFVVTNPAYLALAY